MMMLKKANEVHPEPLHLKLQKIDSNSPESPQLIHLQAVVAETSPESP